MVYLLTTSVQIKFLTMFYYKIALFKILNPFFEYKMFQLGWRNMWISGLLLRHSDKYSHSPVWTLSPRIGRAGPSLCTYSCPVGEYVPPEWTNVNTVISDCTKRSSLKERWSFAHLPSVLAQYDHYRIIFAFRNNRFKHVLLHICHRRKKQRVIQDFS